MCRMRVSALMLCRVPQTRAYTPAYSLKMSACVVAVACRSHEHTAMHSLCKSAHVLCLSGHAWRQHGRSRQHGSAAGQNRGQPCVHSGAQKSPIQVPQGIIVSPWARNSTFFDLWGRVVGSLVAFLRIGLHFVCPREKGAAISDVLWKTFCHKFMETMAAVQPRST